jgi:arabinogalactan endo-1,4-beta-galactosidase
MNKKDKSIIPLEQNALIRLENSMVITNEILSCQESRLYKLDWDFIIRHRVFFNEFLSSYYPFTEREIINFIDDIEIGGMFF